MVCRIEPARDLLNKDAVARYHAIFSAIKKAGLEPVATLHHFVHPKWFEDIGGFQEEGNLPLFVNFCETVVKEFAQYATQWVTFNEPAVICITGYWFGIFPPGAALLVMSYQAAAIAYNILFFGCPHKTNKSRITPV